MNRMEFLKEMGSGLFQTVKSAYEPFFVEDLVKIEEAADRALGITWLPVMNENVPVVNLEMKFIAGRPIIISRLGTNIQATSGICPVCSNIINVTALYSSGKCLNCEKEYNFKTNEGDLKLEILHLKVKDQTVFVGVQRHKKQGGSHA
ncbi:hypothetical protein ACF5W4_10695 [Bacillota bacterium Lsc_1132]